MCILIMPFVIYIENDLFCVILLQIVTSYPQHIEDNSIKVIIKVGEVLSSACNFQWTREYKLENNQPNDL